MAKTAGPLTIDVLSLIHISFLQNLLPDGFAVLCFDDPALRELASRFDRKMITYGLDEGGFDYSGRGAVLSGLGSTFTFWRGDEPLTLSLIHI